MAAPVKPHSFTPGAFSGPVLLQKKREHSLVLQRLRESCQAVSEPVKHPAVPLRLEPLDSSLPGGGLSRGAVHEWIGVVDAMRQQQRSSSRGPSERWLPPLMMLIHAAAAALASAEHSSDRVVWIGREIWLYPSALREANTRGLVEGILSSSLFVRAACPAKRLWAADLALRSRAAAVVIVDGSTFDFTATRRLQFAAETGGSLCLLARPPWEQAQLSAAKTRWRVECRPSPHFAPRWTVQLLRCKGVQPTAGASCGRTWTLELHRATRALRVVSDVLDGSGSAKAEQTVLSRIA